ncbi:MAG: ComEA family DNA-binding protein [Actinomycetota bacterium]|nr:ComEA family DNA-binding protein [Actinomycetota bacterium]
MASLPSFPSTDTGDRQDAQKRLMALRMPAEPDDKGPPETVAADGLPQTAPSDRTGSPATSRGGRLVQRWVPDSLRNARWEPGRPGALALSLVAALAAVIAAVGVWRERPVPEPTPALPLVTADTAPGASAPPPLAAPEVVVSVAGRVVRPGLVRLPDGTRVADALTAAGGPLPGTDLMGLNIARRLSDGEQLLIGVAPPPGQPTDGAAPSTPSGESRKVDLNTATLEQLDVLPGVGPVTAQRILDWRAAHGRFISVDQLREVSGIGQARLARLKDLVRV